MAESKYIQTLQEAAAALCLDELRTLSPCSHIGIRLNRGTDYPFCATCGYSADFLAAERSLLNGHPYPACICAAAAAGTSTLYNDRATPYGSYVQNRLCEAPADFTMLPAFRGTCLKYGYNTLGIVPAYGRNRRAAAVLHLADTAPGRLPDTAVAAIEKHAREFAAALEDLAEPADRPAVVMVDDSMLNGVLVQEVLRDHCRTFERFMSAREATAYMRTTPVDLLITELLLPDTDGFAFIDEIRRTSPGRTPDIVLFTAAAPFERPQAALEARGIEWVLEKPVSDMHIFRHIAAEISARRRT